MIEASVILILFLTVGVFFAGGRLMAQNSRKDMVAETARLHKSLAWHEERLQQAKQKDWDYDMVNRITEQLEDTRFQLAQISTRAGK